MFFAIDPAQMRMSIQARQHQIRDFIKGLDEDQLEAFHQILHLADNESTRGYLIGIVQARVMTDFDGCLCGGDDCSADGLLDQEGAEKRTVSVEVEDPTIDIDKLCKEYGVRWDPDTTRVVCTGECDGAMSWPSLDDRMMQPPGVKGCSLCQQKAKFG